MKLLPVAFAVTAALSSPIILAETELVSSLKYGAAYKIVH